MTTLTIRAATSQKAMQEILQRLGPDALILSTRKVDGQYELRASGDTDKGADTGTGTDTGTGADTGTVTATPPISAPPISAPPISAPPVIPAKAGISPNLRTPPNPGTRSPRTATPTPFERSFRAATRAAKATPADPLAALASRLFFAPGLAEPIAPRSIVAGPPGAGKSMLAARLAARILQTDRRLQPRLIAPAPDLLLHEDRLRGWARLMGLRLDRPTVADAMASPDPDPAFPEIFDLSDTGPRTRDLAARLIDSDDTDLILCLPAGTHPALIARLCRDWAAFQPILCLTRLDLWEPEIPELDAIANAGLRLGLITTGTGILDSLRRPGPADLMQWAGAWAAQTGIAAE